jgi:outer membrane protein assembly factor BamB
MKKVLLVYSVLIFSFNSFLTAQITNSEKNKTDCKISWKFKTGNKIYATPTIYNNKLFVGSLDKNFYAIDIKTGKKLWQFQTGHQIMSNALVHKELVFFESGNQLYALDLNGKLKWKYKLCGEKITNSIDAWDFHHSSPIVAKGVIYIGTQLGLVYGIEVKTGKEVFKCQTPNKQIIRTTPIIDGNLIFFGDWDGVFYAWGIDKNEKVWQYDTKNDKSYRWKSAIQTNPVIYKNSVYFGGRSSCLYSLDAKTGKKNWSFRSPTDQWYVGGLQINDGIIYVGSSDQHLFHAFDALTGKLKWETKLDCRIWGTACFEKDKIFIGGISMYKIDKQSGKAEIFVKFEKVNEDKKLGEKYIDRRANIHSSAVVDDGNLYFGSDDGYIYAINLKK